MILVHEHDGEAVRFNPSYIISILQPREGLTGSIIVLDYKDDYVEVRETPEEVDHLIESWHNERANDLAFCLSQQVVALNSRLE